MFYISLLLLVLQKDKLKTLIDVSHMQMKLKHVEIEKGRIMLDLEAEKKSREETEGKNEVMLVSLFFLLWLL